MTTDTFTAETATRLLTNHLKDPSRLEGGDKPRTYLGMSEIGQDEYTLTERLLARLRGEDEETPLSLHWYNWTGNFTEAEIIKALEFQGVRPAEGARQRTVVADFDARFRGHVDYVTSENVLVEIKTINWNGYQNVRRENFPKMAHYDQVQAYLAHGGFARAVIIYYCRDVPFFTWTRDEGPGGWLSETLQANLAPPMWAADVEPDQRQQDFLNQKAQRILAQVDRMGMGG